MGGNTSAESSTSSGVEGPQRPVSDEVSRLPTLSVASPVPTRSHYERVAPSWIGDTVPVVSAVPEPPLPVVPAEETSSSRVLRGFCGGSLAGSMCGMGVWMCGLDRHGCMGV